MSVFQETQLCGSAELFEKRHAGIFGVRLSRMARIKLHQILAASGYELLFRQPWVPARAVKARLFPRMSVAKACLHGRPPFRATSPDLSATRPLFNTALHLVYGYCTAKECGFNRLQMPRLMSSRYQSTVQLEGGSSSCDVQYGRQKHKINLVSV